MAVLPPLPRSARGSSATLETCPDWRVVPLVLAVAVACGGAALPTWFTGAISDILGSEDSL